jgi:hypothetical protein
MTIHSLNAWLDECPRFETPRESWLVARAKCRGFGAYRKATMKLNLSTRHLEVIVPIHEGNADYDRRHMFDLVNWPRLFPDRFSGTGRLWEILKPFGKFGFLTRLVLRGYPSAKGADFTDIFSLEFIVPNQPSKVFVESGHPDAFEPVEITEWGELAKDPKFQFLLGGMSPRKLTQVFQLIKGCTIVVAGTIVDVSGVFGQGRFHALGGAVVRKEVAEAQTA